MQAVDHPTGKTLTLTLDAYLPPASDNRTARPLAVLVMKLHPFFFSFLFFSFLFFSPLSLSLSLDMMLTMLTCASILALGLKVHGGSFISGNSQSDGTSCPYVCTIQEP